MSYMLFKPSAYKEYKLRLPMQGVITLETTFNKDIFTIINEIASRDASFDLMFQVLKESLRYYGYVQSDDDMYTITDSIVRDGYPMYNFPTLIDNIFIHAGFFDNGSEENVDDENKNTYPGEGDTQESKDKCFLYLLRDRAVECGMDEDKFWNSTLGEVRRFIKAYNDNYIQSYKDSLTMAHLTADLVYYSVARIIDPEKAKYPDIMDLNPELFKEELKQRELYRERQEEEMIKENLMNLMKLCAPKDNKENTKKGE